MAAPAGSTGAPGSVTSLPPEAIALAGRMFDAARTGNSELLQPALAAGLPANMTNDKGDTLLMLAAYHGHAELTRTLISHGADPNRLNDRGQSPLAGAVFKLEDGVIEALLNGGADPDYGQPSALECVHMFRQEDKWLTRFETAPGKGKMEGVANATANGSNTSQVNGHSNEAEAGSAAGAGAASANAHGGVPSTGGIAANGEQVEASINGHLPRTEQELLHAYQNR